MRACIGIISYLPDDPEVRNLRLGKLNTLLAQCDAMFHLPIIIIAQNWTGLSIRKDIVKCPLTIYTSGKLGINGARKKLREKFLESGIDYMIHLDDDCILKGDFKAAMQYLAQLRPGCWGFYKPHLMKLAAISKEVYSQIEIPDGGADDEDPFKRFFEDMYIHLMLKKHMPEKMIRFVHVNLDEVSNSAYDEKGNTG